MTEEWGEQLPAIAGSDVHHQQVGAVGTEVVGNATVVVDPLLPPAGEVHLEVAAGVVAAFLALGVPLDVAAPAVEPALDITDGEDEPTARVLGVGAVEVEAERFDVGV